GPLTSNLGYLIQITNYDNLLSDVTPNFASHGWYALVPYGNDPVLNSQFNSASNLVEILDETIEELATQCAPHSKKQIIMATDGMMTCTYQTHDEDGIRYPDGAGPRDCDSQTMQEGFDNYLLAEKQLLHGSFPEPTGWGGVPAVDYPSILERLLQHEIALTVLLSGKYVRPNFLNIEDLNPPEPAPLGPPTPLLDYLSAMALGFGSFGTPPPPGTNYLTGDFFDVAPGCPSTVANCTDEVALEFHRSPGFEFARVNGTLGRLATLSGGLWCPLMPRDPTGTYANGVLMNNRAPGTTQRYSIFEMSKTATAAECASKAVGGVSPYILLTPIKQAGVS
ncbi:MAG: hypothetical protein DCC75_12920, partial [Proteobacteria bacterium]